MQEAAMPHSEEMCLSLYQYATLQYTRGLLPHAQELCLDSLILARKLHKKDSSSHVSPADCSYQDSGLYKQAYSQERDRDRRVCIASLTARHCCILVQTELLAERSPAHIYFWNQVDSWSEIT